MRSGSTKWTASEEHRLRNLVAEGKTAREAGEALGRHPEVVRRKAMAMGLRLTLGRAGQREKAPQVEPKATITIEVPRYSSRTAMMFGDPPIGRSALDQKISSEQARAEARPQQENQHG